MRRQPLEEFIARLTNRTVVDVRRWGKFLLIDLDDSEVLVIHLRMSGQLRYEPDPGVEVERHTHVILALGPEPEIVELRFVDPRTFGEMFISEGCDARGVPVELAHLGRDPINEQFTEPDLEQLSRGRRVAIKTLLLDQSKIVGIGNIYGDEICALARVRPTRRAESLTKPQRRRIVAATLEILNEAIEERGSSLKDQRYRDLFGGLGTYQNHHRVYGRAGLACEQCGAQVKRTVIGGRSAHFCPTCQR